ncbi:MULTISPECIES: hypothetical protein [Oceanimonas]|uniref:Stress protein n=1 Tax=Oceanimonas doudoroffii TaxID=84158 RepID=A0A233RGJ5_9GAMM|nr:MULTISPECIES: hypothetical protein [Oceanimonas]NHI00878.1 hypothetical protein [Oceanimonas sp. MB9]OXY82517.1 hypothetical protein B6S08_03045 [Oceanimonas doudoroffii]
MNEPESSRLQQSLQHGFSLAPKAVLQEGWQRIYGAKLTMVMAAIGVAGSWLLLNHLLLTVAGDSETGDWRASLLGLLISMIMAPMSGGLDMMGIHRAVERPIRANQIFDYFRYVLPLAVASLIMGFMTSLFLPLGAAFGLPAVLAMLPTLVLSVALMFVFPLILEKGLSPFQAILVSLRLFARQWLNLIAIHLILVALFMAAVLSFGIGLVWVAPLYMVVKGIIYREACGVRGAGDATAPASSPSRDHFEA